MDSKEKEKLLEYLKTAIAVETDIETQRQVKESCVDIWEQRRPTFTERPRPNLPAGYGSSPSNGWNVLMTMGIAAPCLFFLFFLPSCDDDAALIFVLMFSIFLGLPLFLVGFSIERNEKKEIAAINERYERCKKEREQILAENKKNKTVYENQFSNWNRANTELLQSFDAPEEETSQIRDKLYAMDVIYPKYRNLPALTSIYEYFITGRCDELSGPHGAYNLYEDEVRKDTVISQLNAVIENLEQIKQSQYQLYQQVKTIQQTTQLIGSELSQIRGYTFALTELTALNVYYSSVTARNARTIAYLNA